MEGWTIIHYLLAFLGGMCVMMFALLIWAWITPTYAGCDHF